MCVASSQVLENIAALEEIAQYSQSSSLPFRLSLHTDETPHMPENLVWIEPQGLKRPILLAHSFGNPLGDVGANHLVNVVPGPAPPYDDLIAEAQLRPTTAYCARFCTRMAV